MSAAPAAPALDRLREQQRQIEELFARYVEHRRDPAYRAPEAMRLASLIFTLLRVHDELESGVLQPALADRIGADPALAEAASQRADVALALDRVESLANADPGRDTAMQELQTEAREWFAASERGLYQLARDSGLNLSRLDTELAARQEALLTSDSGDAAETAGAQSDASQRPR